MRNFATYFIAFTLIGSTSITIAQPVIRADEEATKASKTSDLVSRFQNANKSKTPVDTNRIVPLFAQEEPVPVAKWDGGQLTNTEVSATLAIVRPSNIRVISPEQFATLNRVRQVETVKQLAYEQVLLQKARAAGIDEKTSSIATILQMQEDALLNRLYYQQKVEPRIEELKKKAAKDYYDANKDELYTRPAFDFIRTLHVSTYEMVTAEEGDTLVGIAEGITGDAANASKIRQGVPPYYMRDVPAELDDDVLSSPLTAGEILFVPMNDDARASATALAESLREKLLDGEDIDKIAESVNDDLQVTATQPLNFSSDFNYYDGLKEAADALGETTVSQVVKTPAGLNILALQDSTTTEVIPFADIQEQLEASIAASQDEQRKAIEETRKETLDSLWEKYNVKVNEDIIARTNYTGADPLTSDTVIAEADDFKYTLDQFLNDLRLTGKDWGQLTREERMNVIKISPVITNYLMVKDARAIGLEDNEQFKKQLEVIAMSEIVAAYNRQQADPDDNRVSKEELQAFYTDNLDNYTSPAQVTLRELSKRINMTLPPAQKAESIEKAKKALEEIRSRIHSEEDFAQLARRESQAISTRSRGGIIGTVPDNFRGEAFKNQLRQLKPGEVSEPFLYGSEVMIIRMDDRIAPTVQPFEEVRRRVMHDYARTMPDKLKNQKRDKALEEANFELLF